MVGWRTLNEAHHAGAEEGDKNFLATREADSIGVIWALRVMPPPWHLSFRPGIMMKTLETERLILRPFTMRDLEEIHRLIYADPEVAPAWAGRTRTVDEIQESFAAKVAQQEDDFGFLAVVLKEGNSLIGAVALQRYSPNDDTSYMILENAPNFRVGSNPDFIEVEFTYALGRAYWGQGYGAEAGRVLIEYGFNEMGVSRIVNDVNSQNIHSINLMRRLGFHLQKNLHPNPFGANSDAPGVIGILKDDMKRPHSRSRCRTKY